jgi:hypothetical protein
VRLTGTVKGNTNIVAARVEITGRTAGIVRTIGAAQITPPSATAAAPAPAPGAALPAPGARLPAPSPAPSAVPTSAPTASETRYTAVSFEAAPVAAPAAGPEAAPAAAPARGRPSWWQSSGLPLLGFALLSALLLWRAPQALTRPAQAISDHPWRTLLIGLLAAQFSLILPLATGALVAATSVFWGWFPGVLLAIALLAGFGLLWFLSPLITGVWLGRRLGLALGRGPLEVPLLIAGVVLLALLGQLPTIGLPVYLLSFVLAMGALIETAASRPTPATALAPAAAAPMPLPAVAVASPPPPDAAPLPPPPAPMSAVATPVPDPAPLSPAPVPAAPAPVPDPAPQATREE